MIPDGTSPDAIIIVVAFTMLVACVLMGGLFWYRFPDMPSRIMSSVRRTNPDDRSGSAPVAATSTIARQPIATPGNAVNAELSGNVVAGAVPNEAREIIRMQAKAEAVVKLLKSAKMTNKAEAIELIFECSRSGREGSMYKRAQTLVDAILDEHRYAPLDDQHRRTVDQAA